MCVYVYMFMCIFTYLCVCMCTLCIVYQGCSGLAPFTSVSWGSVRFGSRRLPHIPPPSVQSSPPRPPPSSPLSLHLHPSTLPHPSIRPTPPLPPPSTPTTPSPTPPPFTSAWRGGVEGRGGGSVVGTARLGPVLLHMHSEVRDGNGLYDTAGRKVWFERLWPMSICRFSTVPYQECSPPLIFQLQSVQSTQT